MNVMIDTDEKGFDQVLARNQLGPRKRTAKQAAASRRNGSRSRGPTTVAGKQRASQNAITHGLFAAYPRQQLPVFCERAEYDRVVTAMLVEFGVTTTMGAALVEGLAADLFRLQHVRGMESAVLTRGFARQDDLQAAVQDRDMWVRHRTPEENHTLLQGLQTTLDALRSGSNPGLDGDTQSLVVQELWRAMNEGREDVERETQYIAELDADIQAAGANVPENLTACRQSSQEALDGAVEFMKTRDRTVFGIESESDLQAVLGGDRQVAEDDRPKWTAFVEHLVDALQANMGLSAQAQQRIDEIRRQAMLASVDRMPEMNVISDYEARIRRQIEKTVALIREIESPGVIDV